MSSRILIDDDDDAWSYSFPPSTETLPLLEKKENVPIPNLPKVKPTLTVSSHTECDEESKLMESDDGQSQNSSVGSTNGLNNSTMNCKRLLQLAPISHTSSVSSVSLQPPFLGRATPADPHTTKEDANSIFSNEQKNGLAEASSHISGNNYLNSMKTSIQNLDANRVKSKEIPNTPTSSAEDPKSSPKIIAYRKPHKSISEVHELPQDFPLDIYDRKLYVAQKFKDSEYRYATMKRNTEFHQLFRSLDLTDRLLDDFSCALSREILLQGRVYISETYICFNSNLLGWVTNVVISLKEIIKIEKKSTAGLFPNGISIETKDTKHTFASFLSRDVTYDFMNKVWFEATDNGKNLVENSSEQGSHGSSRPSMEESSNGSPARIQSYILSLDGDDDTSDHDYKDYENNDQTEEVNLKLLKFKEESQYKSKGPEMHAPTTASDGYERKSNEKDLIEETFDAPLGIVFEILFGGSNTTFHRNFLKSHDGSEISDYDQFHPMEDDPTRLERNYTYRRALDYSIGPKSTKCEVSEVVEHLNLTDYIVVVTSTKTPDVPLGHAFSVKTRYVFTWGENNKTKLCMTYYIDWVGSSWIKAIIERQSLSGQLEAATDLIKELKDEITKHTYSIDGPTVLKPIEEETIGKIPAGTPKPSTKEPMVKVIPFSTNEFIKSNVVSVCYLILSFLILLLILQLRNIKAIRETNLLVRSQLMVNSHLAHAIEVLAQTNGNTEYQEKLDTVKNDQLWEWVNEKYGKTLSPMERIEYLTFQLNAVNPNDDDHDSLFNKNVDDTILGIKQLVKEFNYQDLINGDLIKNMVKDLI